MTERTYRFVLGALLWSALIVSAVNESLVPIFAFVGLVLFEGVTNLRIPAIISRIRYGKYQPESGEPTQSTHLRFFNSMEAERALRIIISLFVVGSFYIIPDLIWFLPWFVAGMLILAGITNICPMIMFLRWAGLR